MILLAVVIPLEGMVLVNFALILRKDNFILLTSFLL